MPPHQHSDEQVTHFVAIIRDANVRDEAYAAATKAIIESGSVFAPRYWR